MSTEAKQVWVNIGKQVLTFAAGVIAAAFILGGARQKVVDVYNWKMEVAPKIERMDSRGTLSFELFHAEYMRNQARQDERIKELDGQVRDLERRVPP